MKKETKKLIYKRERLFRVFSRTRKELDFEIRNEVTAAIRRDKLQDISKKCELFKSNKKAFYEYVKAKQSSKQSVIQLKTVDGHLTNDQKEAAKELSTYFKFCVCTGRYEPHSTFSASQLVKSRDNDGKVKIRRST